MEIYPILNKPGKGKYVFIFILNERAVSAAAVRISSSGYLHEVGHEAVAVGGALACAVAVGVDGVER